MHKSVQQVMKIWENGPEKEGIIRGPEKKKLFCSLIPHEPRRPRFSLFERMNMVNKNACEEPHSLQAAERVRDFIGVPNNQYVA